jgi:hypothetical protein
MGTVVCGGGRRTAPRRSGRIIAGPGIVVNDVNSPGA